MPCVQRYLVVASAYLAVTSRGTASLPTSPRMHATVVCATLPIAVSFVSIDGQRSCTIRLSTACLDAETANKPVRRHQVECSGGYRASSYS